MPAGILLPVGPVGPIGSCGTLSPTDSDSAILADPGVVFPSSDLAGMRGSDTPAESAILMGPVGPPMLGPGRTLLLGEDGPGLCPIVSTDDLLSVAAVPLTAVRDPIIAQSLVEGLVRDCDDVGEEGITVPGGWSGPEVDNTPAVVAMVGMDALPMRNDAPLDCVDSAQPVIVVNSVRQLMA